MKEFKTLLESELLNEDVKKQLTEAVEAFKQQVTEDVTKKLEIEHAKKLYKEKKELNAKVLESVKEITTAEIQELKEDINHYRSLEVRYAKLLESFKAEYAEKLRKGVKKLIESRVGAEMGELREDLMEAKKLNFGKKIYEAYASEFEIFGVSPDVKALQKKNEDIAKELTESQKEIATMKREKILEGLLSNLKGGKREIMKNILENVKTEKLSDRYNEAISSVLTEEKTNETQKGKDIITESKSENDPDLEYIRKLIKK